MKKKPHITGILVLAFATGFLLQACDRDSGDNGTAPNNPQPSTNVAVVATLVGSAAEVPNGVPGAYYISQDRRFFYLRCPGGSCTKHNVLLLEPGSGRYVWTLSGSAGRPTLSPSIHWFETDGATTHWHGWLRDGVYTN
jgi:hypothetical protein